MILEFVERGIRKFHLDRPMALFLVFFGYIASITILRPTPWLNIGTGFNFTMGVIWAGTALLAGFASRRPSLLVPCFLLACLGPHHRVAVLCGFLTGLVMLAQVLYRERRDLRAFLRHTFTEKGAGYVLALGSYMAFVWLIRLGDSTDEWSFLALGASMFAVPLCVYSLSYLAWTDDERDLAIRNSGLVLLALGSVVLLYPLAVWMPQQYTMPLYMVYKAVSSAVALPFALTWSNPDFNAASMRSAHYASAVLMLGGIVTGVYAVHRRSRTTGALAALLLYAGGMGENAHALPGLALGVILVAATSRFPRWAGARPGSIVLATLPLLCAAALVAIVYNWDPYLHALPKHTLYTTAIRHAAENPARMLLGEGPAAYASHAAAKRLPDPWRDDRPYPLIGTFTPPRYGEAIRASFGSNRYTTLHRPISGLLGLLMEWGLLGTLLLLSTLASLYRAVYRPSYSHDALVRAAAAAAVGCAALVFVSLAFRPYAEYPDVMAVASIAFLLATLGTGSDRRSAAGA